MTNSLHLNQKFSFNSSWSFIFSIWSVSTHGVDLVDEDDGWLFFSCHVEKSFDQFLTFSHIFAHQVRWRYWEEGSVSLGGTCFCKIGFSCTWRTVEQDTFPGFSATCEDFFESDGKNDCLLQSIFSILESFNILPFNVGFLGNDSITELTLEVVLFFLVSTSSSMVTTSTTSGTLRH